MEIRYTTVARRMNEAVSAYHAALSICGTLAGMWLLDNRRGSLPARFVPGAFYVDAARRTFRCKSLNNNSVCLTHFGSTLGRLIMADIKMDVSQCGMYMEISDPQEIAKLQSRFDFQWRNRGDSVSPQEAGIELATGPEGSYATAMLRLRPQVPPKEKRK